MTTRLEAATSPEIDTRQHGMEVLTPKRYALAGRLIMASVASPTELTQVLNPGEDIQATVMPGLVNKIENPTTPRNLSQITHTLSTREREVEWEGQDLNTALTEWVRGFTTYATTTSKEGRKAVIGGLAGKDITDFTEEDSKKLYETFCEKDSDTGTFVNATIGRLKGTDGRIDTAKLMAEIDDIQWLASRFFGVETAKAVAELIKVEAELTNNRENTIKVLLRDSTTSRIDSLYPEEEELLRKLMDPSLDAADTATTRPVAATTPPPPPTLPPTITWPTPGPISASGPTPAAPVLPREPWTIPAPGSSATTPPAGGPPLFRPRPAVTPAAEGFVSTIPELPEEPAPEPIDEAKLQEAKSSEVGKEVTRILDTYKTLIEREYNAETEEGDQEEKDKLIKELDDAIGNKGIVTDALGMIHKLYKSLSEGRQTPAYKNNREEFLTQNPHFKTLDEDVTQEEAKLYITAHKNIEPAAIPELDEDHDVQWPSAFTQPVTVSPAPPPIATDEDVIPEGTWDGRVAFPTATEPAPEAQGAQPVLTPIDQREPEQDTAEPQIAPPSVRTQEAVLADIAHEAQTRTPITLEDQLAHVQAEIQSITDGTFRNVDGKVPPKTVLEILIDSDQAIEERLRQAIEDQRQAAQGPLFTQQDSQATEDLQPVTTEDRPQTTEPIVEEQLDPLRPAPEPPLFGQQDAAQAAEPEQPAIEEESAQQPNESTGIVGGLLKRFIPENTAE